MLESEVDRMRWKRTGCFLLAVLVWAAGLSASASNIKSIQNQKSQNEKELKNIQSQISGLENKKNALNSEVNGLNDELTETMLGIEVLKDDLEAKEAEIQQAEIDYIAAKETEERQYEAMKLRIQYLYESGTASYMELLLTSDSMAELMNKVDYAGELQEYDSRLLDEYKAAKQAVIDLQNRLEDEKEELMELKRLQEEAARAAAAARAAKNNSNKNDSSSGNSDSSGGSSSGNSDSAGSGSSSGSSGSSGGSSSGSSGGGSGLGGSIASYGQQFIGCPYVFGGNSLTNGTDCSGFVNLVHAHFGISVPRQSGSLAVGGRPVSDADKQPGDVVCYYGHVGIYVGNGMIVHASSERSGIRVSSMYTQTVRAIRRYW